MKKFWIRWSILLLLPTLLLFGCVKQDPAVESVSSIEETEELPPTVEEVFSLEELQHTEYFAAGSLEHIFYGEVNRKGNATGYHSEAFPDTPGSVVEGTRSEENAEGVYQGQVEVNGIPKAGNRGYSTFFPKDWTPQQVVNGINEAYDSRQHDQGNTYLGETEEGLVIQMYLTDKEKIISAFPIY